MNCVNVIDCEECCISEAALCQYDDEVEIKKTV